LQERKKELKSGINVNHEYGKEYLDSDRIANVYFTSDKDAKERIRSLNNLDKDNLNNIRRSSDSKDGIFSDCQCSDHGVDNIDSIDSRQSLNDFDDISIDRTDPYDSEFNKMPVD
jgi:hypothetical protein